MIVINYKKVKPGDKLRIIGSGAPNYAELGDIVTVVKCTPPIDGRCLVVNEDGEHAAFYRATGAERLEPVASEPAEIKDAVMTSDPETDAEKLSELESLFDLCHKADMRAIKQWQAATGRTRVWPDQTALVGWLLGKLDDADNESAQVRTALQPFADSVFNDNGEMTITPRHGSDAYYSAYWAMKGRK